MVTDADVVVGKKYYILRRSRIGSYYGSHVCVNEISNKRISGETWRVYEVIASDYSEQSASVTIFLPVFASNTVPLAVIPLLYLGQNL